MHSCHPVRPSMQSKFPRSAVVWWTGACLGHLRTGADTFTRLEIHTDAPMPEGAAKDFPQPIPELVAQGAQMLLSEEFRAQIQVGEDNK